MQAVDDSAEDPQCHNPREREKKSREWISDTPQSNNAEKGKMKNGLIALINGSFSMCMCVT